MPKRNFTNLPPERQYNFSSSSLINDPLPTSYNWTALGAVTPVKN